MYSNKENVNILTAALLADGVTHAVVCPGSRNAPIVHNLNECGLIACHPVTDERSAGFYAIGISQAMGNIPIAVCVTSGSALLNLAPAVAEAYYQHIPLIVISADRPPQWIDQLDGQTLPQPGALGTFTHKCVSLPEPHDNEERWFCNRLVCEALYHATHGTGGPVHINVPLGEPLFEFNINELPEIRRFGILKPVFSISNHRQLFDHINNARKPMMVIGQTAKEFISTETIRRISTHTVVLQESLSGGAMHFDEVIEATGYHADFMPDYILYIGGTVVSKRLKRFLRASEADTCLLTIAGNGIQDPLMHLTDIIECPDRDTLNKLLNTIDEPLQNNAGNTPNNHDRPTTESRKAFKNRWATALDTAVQHAEDYQPAYSQMAAVKYLEQQLDDMDYGLSVHYANSTAVRLANIWAARHVWCNRGVNGIEGSLSVAAGFSTATQDMVFCVTGDLSFFYDQNALWNNEICGNLRIILLNNRGGGIFRSLKGLDKSPAARQLVYAEHETCARGICTQNDIGYISAHNMEELHTGMVTVLTHISQRPMVLEIITDAETDNKVLNDYFNSFKNLWKDKM